MKDFDNMYPQNNSIKALTRSKEINLNPLSLNFSINAYIQKPFPLWKLVRKSHSLVRICSSNWRTASWYQPCHPAKCSFTVCSFGSPLRSGHQETRVQKTSCEVRNVEHPQALMTYPQNQTACPMIHASHCRKMAFMAGKWPKKKVGQQMILWIFTVDKDVG